MKSILEAIDIAALNQIAYKAGKAIMEVYEGDRDKQELEYKADRSPLTLADRCAHDIIDTELKALYPEIPVLSEESDQIPFSTRRSWTTLWLVDPLDGTKQFVARQGEFTVNIALVQDHIPIMGLIYSPTTEILYYATKDQGAYRISKDGLKERLPSLPQTPKEELTVIGSRSHVTPAFEAYIEEQRQRYRSLRLINIGSSLKFCLIAEGKADIYPRFGPTMEWDTAAGHIIVKECGHNVYRENTSEELTYNKENLLNPGFICKGRVL